MCLLFKWLLEFLPRVAFPSLIHPPPHLRLLRFSHGTHSLLLFCFSHQSFAGCFALLYTTSSSSFACFHVRVIALSIYRSLSSPIPFPCHLLALYFLRTSPLCQPLLVVFTISASCLGLCPSLVSMTLPLLCPCSFIISLLHFLTFFLSPRVLLTKLGLRIYVLKEIYLLCVFGINIRLQSVILFFVCVLKQLIAESCNNTFSVCHMTLSVFLWAGVKCIHLSSSHV